MRGFVNIFFVGGRHLSLLFSIELLFFSQLDKPPPFPWNYVFC